MKTALKLSLLFLLISGNINAQDFVRTVDGKNYWADIKMGIENFDEIPVEDGRSIKRISKSDILLIEYSEGGLKILNPDKIKVIEPKEFDGDIEAFLAEGKNVYIPLASNKIAQRSGAKCLIDLVMESKFYNVVGCEKEANFILEYIFDDSGKDHAYLLFKDRKGNNIIKSPSVGATDWVPAHAGRESATKLYKNIFKNILLKKKLSKKVKKEKNPNVKNDFCQYKFVLNIHN